MAKEKQLEAEGERKETQEKCAFLEKQLNQLKKMIEPGAQQGNGITRDGKTTGKNQGVWRGVEDNQRTRNEARGLNPAMQLGNVEKESENGGVSLPVH